MSEPNLIEQLRDALDDLETAHTEQQIREAKRDCMTALTALEQYEVHEDGDGNVLLVRKP